MSAEYIYNLQQIANINLSLQPLARVPTQDSLFVDRGTNDAVEAPQCTNDFEYIKFVWIYF